MPKFNIQAQAIPTVASAYADIIGTTDNQIVDIKNELIIEDNKQKFQIHDNTIEQLAERIAKDGQLSPCIVAPLPNGKYELIDGRHRRRAVIKAGLPTTKCIIKTGLDEKEKKTIQLTSNLIRNNDYLPSELAFAYKELAELEDMQTISEETNMNKKKIYRYIRLTYLIEPLLSRVDSGVIPLIAAVELSYVSREVQAMVFQYMLNNPSFRITTDNAKIIKFNGHSFPTVLEVIEENNKQKTENENVDNLSIDESENEPEEHTEESQEQTEADNLSTNSNELTVNTSTPKPDLWFQDENGTIHSCADIDMDHLKCICEFIICSTHIDYYIIRYAYDSKDIIKRWNEKEIKMHHGQSVVDKENNIVGFADWISSEKRMFKIRIHGQFYIMPHRVLEQLVRRYIRESYDIKRIISVIRENH